MKKLFIVIVLILALSFCGCSSLSYLIGDAFETVPSQNTYEYTDTLIAEELEELCASGEAELSFGVLDDGTKTLNDRIEQDIVDAVNNVYICAKYVDTYSWQIEPRLTHMYVTLGLTYTDERSELDALLLSGTDLTPVPFTYESYRRAMLEMVDERATERTFYFTPDGDVSEDIRSALQKMFDTEALFSYCLDETPWLYYQYPDRVEVVQSLEYRPDVAEFSNIPIAYGMIDAVNKIIEMRVNGDEHAVFFVTDNTWDYDTLFEITSMADANDADIACDSSMYNYDLFPDECEPGEMRIAEVWVDYEISSADLGRCNESLRDTLDAYEQELRSYTYESEKQLLRVIHDIVVDSAEYDDDIADASESDSLTPSMLISRSAYGALVSKNTVCTGYASAFKALCDRVGLDCWVVYGSQDGGGHAWNAVLLDGEVYYVDCTFDDTGSKSDKYFLFSESKMKRRDYVFDEGFMLPW